MYSVLLHLLIIPIFSTAYLHFSSFPSSCTLLSPQISVICKLHSPQRFLSDLICPPKQKRRRLELFLDALSPPPIILMSVPQYTSLVSHSSHTCPTPLSHFSATPDRLMLYHSSSLYALSFAFYKSTRTQCIFLWPSFHSFISILKQDQSSIQNQWRVQIKITFSFILTSPLCVSQVSVAARNLATVPSAHQHRRMARHSSLCVIGPCSAGVHYLSFTAWKRFSECHLPALLL